MAVKYIHTGVGLGRSMRRALQKKAWRKERNAARELLRALRNKMAEELKAATATEKITKKASGN